MTMHIQSWYQRWDLGIKHYCELSVCVQWGVSTSAGCLRWHWSAIDLHHGEHWWPSRFSHSVRWRSHLVWSTQPDPHNWYPTPTHTSNRSLSIMWRGVWGGYPCYSLTFVRDVNGSGLKKEIFGRRGGITWSFNPTLIMIISPTILIQPEPQGLWEFTPRLNHTYR